MSRSSNPAARASIRGSVAKLRPMRGRASLPRPRCAPRRHRTPPARPPVLRASPRDLTRGGAWRSPAASRSSPVAGRRRSDRVGLPQRSQMPVSTTGRCGTIAFGGVRAARATIRRRLPRGVAVPRCRRPYPTDLKNVPACVRTIARRNAPPTRDRPHGGSATDGTERVVGGDGWDVWETWCRKRDSNPRPPHYERGVPTDLSRESNGLTAVRRLPLTPDSTGYAPKCAHAPGG